MLRRYTDPRRARRNADHVDASAIDWSNMSEDDLLTAVMDLLRVYRWMAWHVRNSKAGVVQGDPGFPDILACRPPRLMAIELKTEKGVLTPLQNVWAAAMKQSPGVEYHVFRPSDYLDATIEGVLR
jgi:hypothetical protein